MNNHCSELFISAPWGRIAVLTWGQPTNQPVLMVHGWYDSAATFIPLVDQLPQQFYYVAIDLPGNGRSDPFPKGLALSRFHSIHVVEVIVKHMGWKNFIFLGHSMGCEIGLFYNASTPGVISRFIHLDPGPDLQWLQQFDIEGFFRYCYHEYYANYSRYNGPNKLFTERQAVEAIMKSRKMTEDQARLLLSRSLVHVEGDKYSLSWDSRIKLIAAPNMSKEFYLTIFTRNAPPSLIISMTEGDLENSGDKDTAEWLIDHMVQRIRHARRVILQGGHDHHVTHSGEVGKYVMEFLDEAFEVKSKV